MRLMVLAWALSVLIAALMSPLGASADCPATVDRLELIAVGRVHGYAEYGISLKGVAEETKVWLGITERTGRQQVVEGPVIPANRLGGDARALLVLFWEQPSLASGTIARVRKSADGSEVGCDGAEHALDSIHTAVTQVEDGAITAPTIAIVESLTSASFTSKVFPDYPAAAKFQGIQGRVTLEVLIGPDGKVLDVGIKTPANQLLNEASLTAARRSTFRPVTANGEPIPYRYLIDYYFRLEGM
jgi:TonB family protein